MDLLRNETSQDTGSAFKHRSANVFLATGVLFAVAFEIGALASPRGNAVIALLGLFQLVLGLRIWMLGVYLGSEGIRVVNVFSTKTVPWDEVERFEVAPLGEYRYCGYLDRRGDGGRIAIFYLASKQEGPGRDPQKTVDELNEVLRLRRTDPNSLQGLIDALQ